jgi:hypothetical protein
VPAHRGAGGAAIVCTQSAIRPPLSSLTTERTTALKRARTAGSASFENVEARNIGAVGVNNCGSFHFTPAGSEFSLTDLGGKGPMAFPP